MACKHFLPIIVISQPTIYDILAIQKIHINSEGLIYSSVSLLSTLIVLYTILALNKFKLDKKVGFICLAMYSIFLAIASLIELNVFFVVNKPTCIWIEFFF